MKTVGARSSSDKKSDTSIWSYLSYIYIGLPFFIFMIGWLKVWILIPLLALMLLVMFKVTQSIPKTWKPDFSTSKSKWILGAVLLTIFIWVYFSGIGCLSFQNLDHQARNGIFEALVNYSWPVKFPTHTNISYLVYYFGFWLPSAVVGKIFGLAAGYNFQVIWAIFGIIIVYYYLSMAIRKISMWPILGFVFFGGMDLFVTILTWKNLHDIATTDTINGVGFFQYSSFTTQLYWVFNQSIPIWVATLMIFLVKDNRRIILIWAFTMLNGVLPFIGLLPVVIYKILQGNESKNFWKNIFLSVLTIENIVGGGIVGITTALLITSSKSAGIRFALPQSIGQWWSYGITLIFEIGIYLFILRKIKDRALYYMLCACFVIYPFIFVGGGGDFSMRASIPLLVITFVLLEKTYFDALEQKNIGLVVLMTVVFMAGTPTPAREIERAINYDVQEGVAKVNKTPFADTQRHIEYSTKFYQSPYSPYYLGQDQSLFFKYLAK